MHRAKHSSPSLSSAAAGRLAEGQAGHVVFCIIAVATLSLSADSTPDAPARQRYTDGRNGTWPEGMLYDTCTRAATMTLTDEGGGEHLVRASRPAKYQTTTRGPMTTMPLGGTRLHDDTPVWPLLSSRTLLLPSSSSSSSCLIAFANDRTAAMSTRWIAELPELVTLARLREREGGREGLPLGAWIVRHHQPDVTVQTVPALDRPLSKGDLYVTESCLAFFSPAEGKGIAIEYPAMGIHAIARQPTDHAPCVYCQVDGRLPATTSANGAELDAEANEEQRQRQQQEEEDTVTEIRFIPDDFSTLDTVFEAISECSALHPDTDPMEAGGDDDALVDGQYYTGELDPQELSEANQAALAYLDSIVDAAPVSETHASSDEHIDKDEGQFADADEENA
ncbi:regulator of volume decrease after cellular swelling-domain-containing protein [Syncephalis pseudoplumigaleata]|uniref:Regulator of volume decrease after cellular swelling-domain-containing protein n=1 Tax=Syncephalis pseudoplumigaleata TaxID=1712513 RepID=A0A4P9Z0W3_9FUNG|nr:regulator of volume decrease after cellular swelling-domain-containing protein [Syncephalis pseudoplumigaleata]|eukprot:RKP26103.1 regulator of volume decrease after cellular swelling-domain-containing protein [Syncephalis pseudoplumigaleata]